MMNEKGIGVYICHCELNIAGIVDVEEVAKYATALPHVVISRGYRYICSAPGQSLIKKLELNRVALASCSPRMHELTFCKACEDTGLLPHLKVKS